MSYITYRAPAVEIYKGHRRGMTGSNDTAPSSSSPSYTLQAGTVKMFFTPAIITAILGFAAAHPGHDIQGEAHERREYLTTAKRADLSHCSAKLEARAVRNQALARRSALARRQAAGTPNITALDESHDRTSEGVNLDTPVGKIFQNGSCVLKPEVTEGPYCVSPEYDIFHLACGRWLT